MVFKTLSALVQIILHIFILRHDFGNIEIWLIQAPKVVCVTIINFDLTDIKVMTSITHLTSIQLIIHLEAIIDWMVIILLQSIHVFTCRYIHFITFVTWSWSPTIKICISWIVVYNVYFRSWRLLLNISTNTFANMFVLWLWNRIIIFALWVIQLLYWHIFCHVLYILSFCSSSTFLNLCCASWSLVLVLIVYVIHFIYSSEVLIWCNKTVFMARKIWCFLSIIAIRLPLIFS